MSTTTLPTITEYLNQHFAADAARKMVQVERAERTSYAPNAVDENGVPVFIDRPVVEIKYIGDMGNRNGGPMASDF